MKKLIITFCIIMIFSCEKQEIPIKKVDRGGVNTTQINMQSNVNYLEFNYHNQVYFNLDNNVVVKENLKTNWDIAFESNQNGWKIIVNSSKNCNVIELENFHFDNEIDVSDYNFITERWDSPEGINYTTAIGDYRDMNSVFIIDRGYKLNGSLYGKKKLFIEEVNDMLYRIKYSNLDNSDLVMLTINKSINSNFEFLSFESNSIINVEPPKNQWDLVFTQYTHLFENQNIITPYLVTGVLSNYLNDITIAIDTNYSFTDISVNNLDEFVFSGNQNTIGYKWKDYSITSSSYTVNAKINYIIKDQNNKYFKLRFIDFYNSLGSVGYPTFEFQEL